jgi:hypothetical protein
MPPPADIAFRDASFVVAFMDRLVVAITEGDATLAAIDAWDKNIEMASRAYPDGIGVFFVVGESAVIPSGIVRARADELFKKLGGKVKVMATVIEGGGFATAAKRAAFTLISSASIGSVRLKVLADVSKGAEWLAAEAPRAKLKCPEAAAISAFVGQLERPSGSRPRL